MNKKKPLDEREAELRKLCESMRPSENDIPKRVDDAVFAAIQAKTTPAKVADKRSHKIYYWFGYAVAAAIVLAVSIIFIPGIKTDNQPEQENKNVKSHDIVDIYRLNRKIDSGEKIAESWDADGNGIINQNDVDIFIKQIVKVD